MTAEVKGEAIVESLREACATFPPGRRDDVLFDRVALGAVEGVGLVGLVEDADGHQEQATARQAIEGRADRPLVAIDAQMIAPKTATEAARAP